MAAVNGSIEADADAWGNLSEVSLLVSLHKAALGTQIFIYSVADYGNVNLAESNIMLHW